MRKNIKILTREDPGILEENAALSRKLELSEKVAKEEVPEKVAEVSKRKDLPTGYIKLFKTPEK